VVQYMQINCASLRRVAACQPGHTARVAGRLRGCWGLHCNQTLLAVEPLKTARPLKQCAPPAAFQTRSTYVIHWQGSSQLLLPRGGGHCRADAILVWPQRSPRTTDIHNKDVQRGVFLEAQLRLPLRARERACWWPRRQWLLHVPAVGLRTV
jgi:hypothetical protein